MIWIKLDQLKALLLRDRISLGKQKEYVNIIVICTVSDLLLVSALLTWNRFHKLL